MIKLKRMMEKSLTNNFKSNLMRMEKNSKDKKNKMESKLVKKENKFKLVKKVLRNSLKMLIAMVNLYKIMDLMKTSISAL